MNLKRGVLFLLLGILLVLALEILTPINLVGFVVGNPAPNPGHDLSQINVDTNLVMVHKNISGTMAGSDSWKIYGEGLDNAGKLIIESGDDGTEAIIFRQKNTNPNPDTYRDAMIINSIGNVGIGESPTSLLSIKNNYDADSRISIGALSIGGNQGSAAEWARWYWGYNMFWNGDYNSGKWKASDGTYRSIFINDNNVLRYIMGLPDGQTEWTPAQLRDYTKFSVNSAGDVVASGSVTGSSLCIGADCKTSWPSSGTSYWTAATGGIQYSGGNVGIGDSTPTAKLDVAGDITALRMRLTATSSKGACTSANEGVLVYEKIIGQYLDDYYLYICMGSTWIQLAHTSVG